MGGVSWIPRIGDEFAGYRLVALIGHGGMSIVYRAEHIGLGRTVALKLLSPELSEDEGFRERFERESRIAAALEHPNIIPIYEAGEEDGVLLHRHALRRRRRPEDSAEAGGPDRRRPGGLAGRAGGCGARGRPRTRASSTAT